MFDAKIKMYTDHGTDFTNLKLRFEKSAQGPIPGVASKKHFPGTRDPIMTFPLEFLIMKDDMTKIPANAHLLKLEQ